MAHQSNQFESAKIEFVRFHSMPEGESFPVITPTGRPFHTREDLLKETLVTGPTPVRHTTITGGWDRPRYGFTATLLKVRNAISSTTVVINGYTEDDKICFASGSMDPDIKLFINRVMVFEDVEHTAGVSSKIVSDHHVHPPRAAIMAEAEYRARPKDIIDHLLGNVVAQEHMHGSGMANEVYCFSSLATHSTISNVADESADRWVNRLLSAIDNAENSRVSFYTDAEERRSADVERLGEISNELSVGSLFSVPAITDLTCMTNLLQDGWIALHDLQSIVTASIDCVVDRAITISTQENLTEVYGDVVFAGLNRAYRAALASMSVMGVASINMVCNHKYYNATVIPMGHSLGPEHAVEDNSERNAVLQDLSRELVDILKDCAMPAVSIVANIKGVIEVTFIDDNLMPQLIVPMFVTGLVSSQTVMADGLPRFSNWLRDALDATPPDHIPSEKDE